jgi:ABC-type transporter Mla subunit MlaD
MDDWSKQFWNSFGDAVQQFTDQLTQDTERWFDGLTEQLGEVSEAFVHTTDQWAEQVQDALAPEIDRIVDEINRTVEPLGYTVDDQFDEVADQLDQAVGPFLTTFMAGLDQWFEEVSAPINSTVEPILQNYPACVGCRNFCGQTYGGNTLVCAIHPFGPETEQCADWDSVWPQPPAAEE